MVAYLERSACDDGLVGATYLVLAMVRFGGGRVYQDPVVMGIYPWIQWLGLSIDGFV